MKVVCISDTHNKHRYLYCGSGDLLIHSGDCTGRGTESEIENFLQWFSTQDFIHKVLIAGNHDWGFEKDPELYEKMCEDYGVVYLNDSGYTIYAEDGTEEMKLWGSPVTPEFFDWAFNRRREEDEDSEYDWIKPHWDKIPRDTDILITHGPPKGIRDRVELKCSVNNGEDVGCPYLLEAIKEIKPRIHVFGHIHTGYGKSRIEKTTFVNASQLNDSYNVVNPPVVLRIY